MNINFRSPADLRQALIEQADAQSVSLSDYVRTVLLDHCHLKPRSVSDKRSLRLKRVAATA
jgi:hypothetical protein